LGFDFPFGLLRALVNQQTWQEFVRGFHERYSDPTESRRVCREVSRCSELKRTTDDESHTPFSPHNLRLFRQTYYGIHDLLYLLVSNGEAGVLPMQNAGTRAPWILEACPASTLKQERLYWPYKGKTAERRQNREQILGRLQAHTPLSVPDRSVVSAILNDPGGDALDSVIAALATFRALEEPESLAVDPLPQSVCGGGICVRVVLANSRRDARFGVLGCNCDTL
jgi:hypothetical protein